MVGSVGASLCPPLIGVSALANEKPLLSPGGVSFWSLPMEQERKTEDQMACEKLGPQGVSGKPDVHERPQKVDEQIPKAGEFDGHVA